MFHIIFTWLQLSTGRYGEIRCNRVVSRTVSTDPNSPSFQSCSLRQIGALAPRTPVGQHQSLHFHATDIKQVSLVQQPVSVRPSMISEPLTNNSAALPLVDAFLATTCIETDTNVIIHELAAKKCVLKVM